jgi:hypothetical protein
LTTPSLLSRGTRARLFRENSLRHYCQSKIESRSFDWSAIRERMVLFAQDDRVKEQDDKVELAGITG